MALDLQEDIEALSSADMSPEQKAKLDKIIGLAEKRGMYKPAQTSNLSLDKISPDAAPAQGFLDVPSNREGLRKAVQIGLPAMATMATAPFTGGMSLPAVYGAEALASLGAEGLLQATGVSEFSPGQLGMAAAAPGVGRLAATGLAQIPRMIPGVGNALRANMVGAAEQIGNRLLPGPSSKDLYEKVAQGNVKAVLPDFPALATAVKDLGDDVGKVPWDKLQQDLKGTGLETLFEQITQSLKGVSAKVAKQGPVVSGKAQSLPTGLPSQSVQVAPARPGGLTFEEAQAAIEGFGKVISRTTDPAMRGNYKQLYKAILTDLETMPAPPGTPVKIWGEAREAYKLEKARLLLSEQLERAKLTKDGVDILNPDAMVKWLRTNKEFANRVDPKALKAIETEFREMSKAGGHNMSKFMGLIFGGAVSGGAGGAAAGYIVAEKLSTALMTETGRRLVHAALKNPSTSNWRRLGAINGAAAAGVFDSPGKLFGSDQLQPAP